MTEQQARVDELVGRIEEHQAALRLNDSRFVSRYQRYLGSTDTWRRRLCARKWSEFGKNLDKWERKLRQFVTELDGGSEMLEFFPSLPIAQYGQTIFDALEGQRNDRRCAWLIGPTGVGKSLTMRWLARENRSTTAYLHVNQGVRNRMGALALLLARAVGATEAASGSATYENVVEVLKGNPMTMIIDDVHEGGVLFLKLIKHLVDDSRAKFVLGTYPTAWKQLMHGSTDALSEAQQLLGRSLKPINEQWKEGVTEADVTAYLKVAMGGNGECRVLAKKITPLLTRFWNFRGLADAVELATMNADDGDGEVTPEMIEEAVIELCPVKRRGRAEG